VLVPYLSGETAGVYMNMGNEEIMSPYRPTVAHNFFRGLLILMIFTDIYATTQ